MRITVVGINYRPEVTGIAPYTTGIAEGLARRGHAVTVMTGVPHYPEWRVAEAYRAARRYNEALEGVTVRRIRHFVPEKPSARGRIQMEASFARNVLLHGWNKPDLVVAVSPTLLSAAVVVARARLGRVPVGVIVQDVYSAGVVETGAMGGRSARMAAGIESTVLRHATGVAVIHDRLAAALRDIGVTDDHMSVIRNWTHIDGNAGPAEDALSARATFGWQSHETIVLHTGNMGVKQGLENVVAAAKLADESNGTARPVRFVLVGDGNQRRLLEAQASSVDSIELIDPLPAAEFRAALDAADILLVNERPGVGSMAVPSKLTSYFVAGKPILAATDPSSGSADELRLSGAGVAVRPGDPQALLDAARALASDDVAIRRLGEQGRRYATEVLSATSAIAEYDKWCDSLQTRRHANLR
jgi:glycosyltransferase involved in cell wall biosynthesis